MAFFGFTSIFRVYRRYRAYRVGRLGYDRRALGRELVRRYGARGAYRELFGRRRQGRGRRAGAQGRAVRRYGASRFGRLARAGFIRPGETELGNYYRANELHVRQSFRIRLPRLTGGSVSERAEFARYQGRLARAMQQELDGGMERMGRAQDRITPSRTGRLRFGNKARADASWAGGAVHGGLVVENRTAYAPWVVPLRESYYPMRKRLRRVVSAASSRAYRRVRPPV